MTSIAPKMKVAPAKILSQRSHIAAGKLKVTEHWFEVPKDYSKPDGGTLKVFARSVKKHDIPIVPDASKGKEKDQLPWMCFFQGGPGMRCGPPQHHSISSTIVDKGYHLLFLDQRGVGLSTPLTASTLQMRGGTDVQTKYAKLFRADNIVRDAEAIRQALTADYPEEKKKWSIIGQSFGGFCSATYLSFYPEGLRESFIFGGLPPLVKGPDEVYKRLYERVARRNQVYYEKYPEDIEHVKTIMNYLKRFGDGKIKLPSEGSLTRRRFRQLGIFFGFHGGIDTVHDIVLRASSDVEAFGHLTRGSLSAIDRAMVFDEAIIYAMLHEPLYCQGEAPRWSAERLMATLPVFDLEKEGNDEPTYFTGEMVYPWMFEDYKELAKVQDVAEALAADNEWPALYDEEQLARNEVPVFAASYIEDMYVDYDLSMQAARKIRNCKVFATNVMFHDAMRSKVDEVLKQAFALRDDVID